MPYVISWDGSTIRAAATADVAATVAAEQAAGNTVDAIYQDDDMIPVSASDLEDLLVAVGVGSALGQAILRRLNPGRV